MKTHILAISTGIMVLTLGFLVSCGRPPHFGHHARPEKMLKRIDKKVAKLNLTNEQQEAYSALRSKIETDLKKHAPEHRAFFDEMKSEMAKEKPDVLRLTGEIKTKLDQIPEKMSTHIGYFEEFYQILDDTQQTQFVEHIRKKMKRGPFGHKFWGKG
jgi:Spy/CpxP family protein refolding chaperone